MFLLAEKGTAFFRIFIPHSFLFFMPFASFSFPPPCRITFQLRMTMKDVGRAPYYVISRLSLPILEVVKAD
jgi:hypothetical protein